eukprot:s130_g40.t1
MELKQMPIIFTVRFLRCVEGICTTAKSDVLLNVANLRWDCWRMVRIDQILYLRLVVLLFDCHCLSVANPFGLWPRPDPPREGRGETVKLRRILFSRDGRGTQKGMGFVCPSEDAQRRVRIVLLMPKGRAKVSACCFQ